jgi:hypothetical protein
MIDDPQLSRRRGQRPGVDQLDDGVGGERLLDALGERLDAKRPAELEPPPARNEASPMRELDRPPDRMPLARRPAAGTCPDHR